jgi:malic enzyme
VCTKGTAGVAIAGLLGAVRAQGRPMIDFPKQRIVVAGAGRSGTLSVFNPFFSLGLIR